MLQGDYRRPYPFTIFVPERGELVQVHIEMKDLLAFTWAGLQDAIIAALVKIGVKGADWITIFKTPLQTCLLAKGDELDEWQWAHSLAKTPIVDVRGVKDGPEMSVWLQDHWLVDDLVHGLCRSRSHPIPWLQVYDMAIKQVKLITDLPVATPLQSTDLASAKVDVYAFLSPRPVMLQMHPPDLSPEGLQDTGLTPVRCKNDVRDTYYDVFPWGVPVDKVCLLVNPRPPLGVARMTFIYQNPTSPPSTGGTTSEFKKWQQRLETTIYCGRPADAQPEVPPSLLDASLSHLRYNVNHIQPEPADCRALRLLLGTAREFYQCEAGPEGRSYTFIQALKKGGVWPDSDVPVGHTCGLLNSMGQPHHLYRTDGDLRITNDNIMDMDTLERDSVMYFLQEVKNEIDGSGVQPLFQGLRYWLEHWWVKIERINRPWQWMDGTDQKLNFPCIIVLNFGSYLELCCAAWGDQPCAETVGFIPLHYNDTNMMKEQEALRVVVSLRVGLRELKDFYANLNPNHP